MGRFTPAAFLDVHKSESSLSSHLQALAAEVKACNRALAESREQQAATAQILKVIASSPTDVQPVFDAIVETTKRLFAARGAVVTRMVDGSLQLAAFTGTGKAGHDALKRIFAKGPLPPSNPHAIAVSTAEPIYRSDIENDPGVSDEEKEVARARGYRSLLVVPTLREGISIGTLGVSRPEPGAFSMHEISLLETFASQAVIAIENVRLFNEVQEKSRQLEAAGHTLERRVEEEVAQVGRLGRLKRFFSPQLADLIVTGGAEDPLRTHRRQVTVVFLDLRGFTAFAERVEPEELMGVLREYHAAMGELIVEHEGTLERFTGDGMMIFFNDPVEVPDHAERAVRMAVAMRERVASLIAKWKGRGWDLALGVGIAQGYATIGAIGFEGRWDYGAIGTVTNLAARLCAEAKGGQILLSPHTANAVAHLVEGEQVGSFALKGLQQPVTPVSVKGLKKPR